jgi:hypothetical protein
MKRSLLFVLLYCIAVPFLISQTIGVDKLNVAGNRGWDLVSDIAIDDNGNYYITGSFSGEIHIGGITLTSSGQRDIFIVKLDNENNITWAKKIGGEFDEHPHAISFSNNQLYLSGSFNKSIDFTGQINAIGGTDAFFAQLSPEGVIQWTKALHGTTGAQKVLLKNDTQGNIILGGSFEKNLQLDDTATITAESGKDVYSAKYDVNGTLLSYKHFTGEGDENLNAIVIDEGDNIYLGGSYEKNMEFGTSTVNSYGKLDIFLAKYNTNGDRLWYRVAGGVYDDEVKALALDGQGNIYVAIEFDLSMKIVTNTYNAATGSDVVIIKSTQSSGAPVWIRQLGGTSKNSVSSATYGNGKFYISGNFSGEFQAGEKYKSKGIFEDAYIASFADNGTFGWFKKAGGSGEDNIWLKYLPQNERVVCAGYFSDDFSFASYESITNNFSEIFFGTLIDCDLVPHVNLGPDQTICSGTEITVEGNFVKYTWEHGPVTQSIVPENSGTYTVTVEDNYGCESTDAIDLIVNPSPEFDLGEDVTLPENATLTLDLALAPGTYSYLWSTGSTDAVLSIPMSSITSPTSISLTVTAGNNCEYTDEVLVTPEDVPPPVSMAFKSTTDSDNTKQEVQNELSLTEETNYRIYPNPGNGTFYIKGERLKDAKQIDVFNSSGNYIKTFENINSYPIKMDLSGYPKGTYLIKISETVQAFDF